MDSIKLKGKDFGSGGLSFSTQASMCESQHASVDNDPPPPLFFYFYSNKNNDALKKRKKKKA